MTTVSEETLADLLGVARETVSRWWAAFQKGGLEAIPHDRTGRPVGSGRSLSEEQGITIQTILKTQSLQECGIVSPLWTRRAVRELIAQQCGIDMPVRTVGEYLKRWGYSRYARQRGFFQKKSSPDFAAMLGAGVPSCDNRQVIFPEPPWPDPRKPMAAAQRPRGWSSLPARVHTLPKISGYSPIWLSRSLSNRMTTTR